MVDFGSKSLPLEIGAGEQVQLSFSLPDNPEPVELGFFIDDGSNLHPMRFALGGSTAVRAKKKPSIQ